jgi:hypothetical protein
MTLFPRITSPSSLLPLEYLRLVTPLRRLIPNSKAGLSELVERYIIIAR